MHVIHHAKREEVMNRLQHFGYYPLNERNIHLHVPATGGIYLLATKRDDGSFANFYSSFTDDLALTMYFHLQRREHIPTLYNVGAAEDFFFAFVRVSPKHDHIHGIGKLLLHTSDPISCLDVINRN
jgi:hypothetical protein